VDGYKKAETDQRISAAVDAHNGAENAHSDIRASVAAMNASIKAIELKFGTNVTKNTFLRRRRNDVVVRRRYGRTTTTTVRYGTGRYGYVRYVT